MDLQGPVEEVARRLLGCLLRVDGVELRITETEAYGGSDDLASHARVRTARSEVMFGPPGRLYVYRIHTHHCANIVTGPPGSASAVLLRAGEIVDGIELARSRRPGVADQRLARGPGNLGRALALTLADDGDPIDRGRFRLGESSLEEGRTIRSGPRIGISRETERPWRFWLDGEPSVSGPRR